MYSNGGWGVSNKVRQPNGGEHQQLFLTNLRALIPNFRVRMSCQAQFSSKMGPKWPKRPFLPKDMFSNIKIVWGCILHILENRDFPIVIWGGGEFLRFLRTPPPPLPKKSSSSVCVWEGGLKNGQKRLFGPLWAHFTRKLCLPAHSNPEIRNQRPQISQKRLLVVLLHLAA